MRVLHALAPSMTSSHRSALSGAPAHPDAPPPITPGLSTPVLLLMAVACGLCAGSNYFNQPLLHSIATQLQVRDASAALIVTLAQVAYAAGLLLLVPLGDLLERRRLIVTLMLLAALGLFTSGFAHSYAMLALGTLLTGLFSVAAQVLVPLAATLATPGRSGRAVGLVMSGLLTGILAARSVAASLVASAFFRYTTWMLPLAALLPGAGGWSSLSTRARTWATRAGLAARSTRALLRGSASRVVLAPVSL